MKRLNIKNDFVKLKRIKNLPKRNLRQRKESKNKSRRIKRLDGRR